jgi:hypothetical protein
MRNKFIFLLTTLVMLTSCVGTVTDKNAKVGKITSEGDQVSSISFNGLSGVNPIAHDKIELFFFPATGDQNSIIYEVYVNSSLTPIPFAPASLTLNSSGEYRAVVSGLNINSTYSFNMRARIKDANTSSSLDPSKALNAKTFSNQTADFLGVSSVDRMPGSLGETQIKLSWIAAKSIGGLFSARNFDPVRYEIKYVSSLAGPSKLNDPNYTGNDLKVIYTSPVPLSGKSTLLDTSTSKILENLTPSTTYYIQVRAIHSNYDAFKFDVKYKHDLNTKYLSITTLSGGDVSSIEDTSFKIVTPANDQIPGTLIGQWESAEGAIFNYKICYKQITTPERIAEVDLINLVPIDFATNNPLVSGITCSNVGSSLTSVEIDSLESFESYQFSLFACLTNDCTSSDRIAFEPVFTYFNPPLPPFNGISQIINPDDNTALRDITIKFDPPATSDGYADSMKIYCFNGDNTTPHDLTNPARTGLCNQVVINGTMPTTYPSDFLAFDEVKLTLTDTVLEKLDGVNKYCFKVVPFNSAAPTEISEDILDNASKVCINPQIITPNILEFEGRNLACVVEGDKLKVTWNKPTGGLYDGYKIYWKDRSTPDFFSYSHAITQTAPAYAPATTYLAHEIADKDTLQYSIPDLTPGTKYGIGVLAYLYDSVAGVYYYSQYNTNVADCSLPLPKARFNSWMQVTAIGPKENGLDTENTFIAETIDSDFHSTPREIEIEPDYLDSDGNSSYLTLAEDSKKGSEQFDGIYGALTSQTAYQQHSDKGIIKISWEDITLINFPAIKDQIHEYASGPKNARTYGYKVFRSSDNQTTWKELTSASSVGQTTNNRGLIFPTSVDWKKLPNLADETTYVSSFTDYSVQHAGEEEIALQKTGVDLARTYHYKIIPVFNGKEIQYDDSTNPNHHIIKVILPPKNMALVNRLMANKSFCEEVNKSINKGADKYYSCLYNGLGSTGLSFPYSNTSAVYDLGGDLLVDRFELGVRVTRGDKGIAASTPAVGATLITGSTGFDGTNSLNANYIGCFGAGRDDRLLTDKAGSSAYDILVDGPRLPNQVGPGDCIGDDYGVILNVFSNNPRGNAQANVRYFYIGAGYNQDLANYFTDTEDGPDGDGTGDDYLDFFNSSFSGDNYYQENYYQTQSSFGSVYVPRRAITSAGSNTFAGFISPAGVTYAHTGAGGQSNAYINLPYVNGAGKFVPRWLDVMGLFGQLRAGGNIATLFDKTFEQIRADSRLYGAGMALPSYDENKLKNRKLIRHITSNAAKLPPVRGLNQQTLHHTCQAYEVKVGFKNDGGTFSTAQSTALKKRIFHRKEFIAASRWPANLDQDQIIQRERGNNPIEPAPTPMNANNGCNSVGKISAASYLASTTRLNAINLKNKEEYNILYPAPLEDGPLVMTGSSLLDNRDNENFSTANCQSRYGIQDLVGNMAEYSSEEILCDASAATINSNTPINYRTKDGFGAWIDNFSIIYNPNFVIDSSYSINNSTTPVAREFFGSIDEVQGGCSISQVGPDSNSYSQTVGSVFNWDGSLSSSMISNSVVISNPLDKESFQSARNGDGTFLSFGSGEILPNLIKEYGNFYRDPAAALTLANLKDLKADYKYFNPALGLPLACDQGSCSSSGDNRTTTFRTDNLNSPGASILDYPIGNSSFNLPGLSDVGLAEAGVMFTFVPGGVTPFYFIDGTGVASDQMNDLSMAAGAIPNAKVSLSKLETIAKTTNAFGFLNGGSNISSFSGRFTLSYDRTKVSEDLPYSSIIGAGGQKPDAGGRCVIMIRE